METPARAKFLKNGWQGVIVFTAVRAVVVVGGCRFPVLWPGASK